MISIDRILLRPDLKTSLLSRTRCKYQQNMPFPKISYFFLHAPFYYSKYAYKTSHAVYTSGYIIMQTHLPLPST